MPEERVPPEAKEFYSSGTRGQLLEELQEEKELQEEEEPQEEEALQEKEDLHH